MLENGPHVMGQGRLGIVWYIVLPLGHAAIKGPPIRQHLLVFSRGRLWQISIARLINLRQLLVQSSPHTRPATPTNSIFGII